MNSALSLTSGKICDIVSAHTDYYNNFVLCSLLSVYRFFEQHFPITSMF